MGLACHRASPARRQAARTESSVAGPPCCICIVVEFRRHHKLEEEKHTRPRMQRTDANIVRLRRALSPPLQHQRKLLFRSSCTTRRSTDASYRCISVSAPTFSKSAPDDGQSSRPEERRPTRHTAHASALLSTSTPCKKCCAILDHRRYYDTAACPSDIQLLNLKNKKSGCACEFPNPST